jgi:hypothetical protein
MEAKWSEVQRDSLLETHPDAAQEIETIRTVLVRHPHK